MSGLTHWHFVAMSYGAAAIIALGAIVAVLRDHRAQKAALARLEARGVRRRAAHQARPEPAVARP